MEDLTTVFRMEEISKETRANLIIKLGDLINYKYASNCTEPVVFELVKILCPEHPILADKQFLSRVPKYKTTPT